MMPSIGFGAGPGPVGPRMGDNRYQMQLRNLLERVSSENLNAISKEQRLNACTECQKMLLGADLRMFEFPKNPMAVLSDLEAVFYSKAMANEVKKATAELIGCWGFIMAAFRSGTEFIKWLFGSLSAASRKDTRALYGKALLKAFEFDRNRRYFPDGAIQLAMSEVQKLLETNNSAVHLSVLLDISEAIAELYPPLFAPHFQDVVDIVVGWLVDVQQRGDTVGRCETTMRSLRQHWQHHGGFCTNLLQNFLEDALGYLKESKKATTSGDADDNCPEDCLLKSAALIRAHHVILSTVADFLLMGMEGDVVTTQLGLIRSCADGAIEASDYGESSDVIVEVSSSLQSIMDVLPPKFELLLAPLVTVFTSLLGCPNFEAKAIVALLNSVTKAVTKVPPDLMAVYVEEFVGPDGVLRPLRFHTDHEVVEAALQLYRTFATPKGIASLTKVYSCITGEMDACLLSIAADWQLANDTVSVLAIESATIFGEEIDRNTADYLLLFLVSSLIELGNAKNSLIGMLGLSPNVFELLCDRMPIGTPLFVSNHPQLHHCIVAVLKAHCEKQDHFVSNSDLLMSLDKGTGFKGTFSQHTGWYTTGIMKLLTTLLLMPTLAAQTRTTVVEWFNSLLSLIPSHSFAILKQRDEFRNMIFALLKSASFGGKDLVGSHFETVDALMQKLSSEMDEKFWKRLLSTFVEVQLKYGVRIPTKLMDQIPFHCFLKANLCRGIISDEERINRGTTSNSLEGGMKFNQEHFKIAVDFILNGQTPQIVPDSLHDRLHLESLSCMKAESLQLDETDFTLKHSSLWRWMVESAAGFCVENRLKTHLGKPLETLNAFEDQLRKLANEALKGRARSGDDHPSNPGVLRPRSRTKEDQSWFRVRCLLLFMDALDKQMYNAYEGAAYAQITPAPTKSARAFFVTNRRVCEEWLSRLRLVWVSVCLSNQQYALAVRAGQPLLQQLQQGSENVKLRTAILEVLLPLLALALEQLGCADSIRGLQKWADTYCQTSLEWLHPCALMADGRYETAAAKFQECLVGNAESGEMGDGSLEANGPKLSSGIVKFVRNQITECHLRLRDTSAAERWMAKLTEFELPNSAQISPDLLRRKQAEYLKALSSFPGENTTRNGSDYEMEGKTAWNRVDQLRSVESNWIFHIVSESPQTEPLKKLSDTIGRLQDVYLSFEYPNRHSAEIEIQRRIVKTLRNEHKNNKDESVIKDLISSILSQETLDGVWCSPGPHQQISSLLEWLANFSNLSLGPEALLRQSILARKVGNLQTSLRLLSRRINGSDEFAAKNQQQTSDDAAAGVAKVVLSRRFPFDISVSRHTAKLLWTMDKKQSAFSSLADCVTRALDTSIDTLLVGVPGDPLLDLVTRRFLLPEIQSQSNTVGDSSAALRVRRDGVARSLLQMSTWLQANAELGALLLTNEDSLFIKLVEEQLTYAEVSIGAKALDNRIIVGSLLILATHICPEFIKGQQALADWAYRAGKKTVEDSNRDEHVLLTPEETSLVLAAVPQDDSTSRDALLNVVSSLKSADGYSSAAELSVAVLRVCPSLSAEWLDSLSLVWERANRRLFLFYDVAARAYFQYLRYTGATETMFSITATLRLLRLLVKHVDQMPVTLQQEFALAEPSCWINVMPQLFARLNHSSSTVRDTLLQLLERMAVYAPHLVCFPAIVGADTLTAESPFTSMLGEEDDDEEEKPDVTEVSSLVGGCGRLVAALTSKDAARVSDVRLFVAELRRITMLREERWLVTLTHLQHEITRRLKQLETEAEKVRRFEHLTAEEKAENLTKKAQIFTFMIFKLLEDLKEVTLPSEESADETPNEKWFVAHYSAAITAAVDTARATEDPRTAWKLFQQLLESISVRVNKRSSQLLDMRQLSPKLAAMTATRIPIPLASSYAGDSASVVTLERVLPAVTTLPTKTRPKKMAFLGSDGKTYTFLFKGQEDLHLDERIMQFLRICNLMLREKRTKNANTSGIDSSEGGNFVAKHYSVTPLGLRSGLIQWVDGANAIFSLYRKWQIRQALSSNSSSATNIPRPSDLYYQKLAPLLEKAGIKDLENRQKWPIDIVRSALMEIAKETPNDLLAKELWLNSCDASEWWLVTGRLARSVAVMSMIGYVLGLGDRHLDNVLLNVNTGNVIHIDYNVCFEKGRYLRVPEMVPFRLTANIRTALGPTDVEGVFRSACERVLGSMRANRETLLTLLEAFVYDPLVDWAPAAATPHATNTTTTLQDQAHTTDTAPGGHLQMGVANFVAAPALVTVYGPSGRQHNDYALVSQLTKDMFRIRRKEILVPWMANRSSLESSVVGVADPLTRLRTLFGDLSQCQQRQRDLEQEAMLTALDAIAAARLEKTSGEIEERKAELLISMKQLLPSLTKQTKALRISLQKHHTIVSDIRLVLRSLVKLEQQKQLYAANELVSPELHPFSDFVVLYKEHLTDPLLNTLKVLADIISGLTSSDQQHDMQINQETVTKLLADLVTILEHLPTVFNALVALEMDEKAEELPGAIIQGETVVGRVSEEWPTLPTLNGIEQETAAIEPAVTETPSISEVAVAKEPMKKKPTVKTQKPIGEARNAHALNVWKRVKSKLEGRDPNPDNSATVEEQVAYVIDEATSVTNLSLMYEGWTAWV